MRYKSSPDGQWVLLDMRIPYAVDLEKMVITEDEDGYPVMDYPEDGPDDFKISIEESLVLQWRGNGFPIFDEILDGIYFARTYVGGRTFKLRNPFPSVGDFVFGIELV